ncbi:MAG: right-handed parallel beta-helix repeat-containing protein [Phycisphaerae bacterium]|jgi:parallel beta-helix repeat protein
MRRLLSTRVLAAVVGGALMLPAAWGEELHVPGGYDTIQAAIDAAQPGDDVVISPGTYAGTGNKDLDFGGKAITVRSTEPADPAVVAATVIDCEGSGRGFYFHAHEGPESVVAGLTITNGYVTAASPGGYYGGGIHCAVSSPTLRDCIIAGNSSTYGGGVCCRGLADAVVINCAITGNTGAGGVYCSNSAPTLANCLIAQNWGDCGVGCSYSAPTLINCTIVGNKAGIGIFSDESSPVLSNCIVWTNNGQAITHYGDGGLIVTYSAIQGGWLGEGNTDADPLVTPDGHLQAGSPCLNAGDPNGEYSGQTDIDGEARVLGGRVDVGADEWLDTDADELPDWWEECYFDDPLAADALGNEDGDSRNNLEEYVHGSDPFAGPRTFHVAVEGDDAWDGLSAEWDGVHGPKATVQAAIDGCGPYEGDTVVIAEGVYAGPGNRDVDCCGKAITVRSTDPDDPDVVAATVVDCEFAGRGFHFRGDEGPDSVLAGLTIRNGHVSGGHAGGGVCVEGSSPVINNCVISLCDAGSGGGVLCDSGSPTLTNCTIRLNRAYASALGGGVYCSGGSPVFINCTINENTADVNGHSTGGGVYCGRGDLTLSGCTICGNAAGSGGGLYCSENSILTLADCTIAQNRTLDYGIGGGMVCRDSSMTLSHCTISQNEATIVGGVYVTGSDAMLTGCTITHNTATTNSGGVYVTGGNATLSGCTISHNAATRNTGGLGCSSTGVVVLSDCTVTHNAVGLYGGGICGSPSLINCIVADNTTDGDGGGLYCSGGDPSLTNCAVTGNSAGGENGGGICCVAGADLTLAGCTIGGNWSAAHGGGICCREGSSAALTNCIVWENNREAIHMTADSLAVATYSAVEGGWSGVGNIDDDPLFVDPENGDFHLSADSPCIDVGDPGFVPAEGETDIDGQYRVGDGDGDGVAIVDMGADEARSPGPGDLNCDGLVNNFDVRAFILAVLDPERYAEQYPDCDIMLGDLTGDGLVNNFDILPFIRLLAGD